MNRPFFLRDHLRREGADGVGGAVEIVVDDVPPVRILHLEERHPALDRGVGDHDVDLAVVLLDLVGDLAQRGDVADVRLDGFAVPPECLDQPDRLVEFFRRRGHGVRGRRDLSRDIDRRRRRRRWPPSRPRSRVRCRGRRR